MPPLIWLAEGHMDYVKAAAALEVMRELPGASAYLAELIRKAPPESSSYDLPTGMKMLVKMKTNESLRAVGEFLFNDANPPLESQGGAPCVPLPSPVRMVALYHLRQAKLEGAPVSEAEINDEEVANYRKWWVEKYGKPEITPSKQEH
ncbi:MAG TPA: hypothetical protein VF585_03850 [Chthoniobacterales bacterium]